MEKNKDGIEGLRWLYDDEYSYQKAVKKIHREQVLEAQKKQFTKKTKQGLGKRIHKAQGRVSKVVKESSSWLPPKWQKPALAVCGLTLVAGGSFVFLQNNKVTEVKGVNRPAKPDYETVLPNNKVSAVSGGQLAYDGSKKVASFVDTIEGQQVTVSQQPLPESFKTSPEAELEKLAKKINCNDLIEVGEVKAYSGLSVKGPQTLVLIKSNVLVFMTSSKKLTNKAWFDYIATLE